MVHSRKKVSISIQIDMIPLRIILILRFSGVKIFIGNTWIRTCNLKIMSLMLYHYTRRKLLRAYILWKTKNTAFPVLLCISFLWRYIASWNVDIEPQAHVSHTYLVKYPTEDDLLPSNFDIDLCSYEMYLGRKDESQPQEYVSCPLYSSISHLNATMYFRVW